LPDGRSSRVRLNVVRSIDYDTIREDVEENLANDDLINGQNSQNPVYQNYEETNQNEELNQEPTRHSEDFITVEKELETNVELACDLELNDYSHLKWKRLSGVRREF
jgi:hypothetical protein